MGQEFFVKSTDLEDKVRQLLPSQGGLGAGFDLSASTQIVPIVDLTESASGSNLRQDLQTAFSLTNTTRGSVSGSSTTLINTTGYWRLQGNASATYTGNATCSINLTDGVSTKKVYELQAYNSAGTDVPCLVGFDFVAYVEAGQQIDLSADTEARLNVQARQIATIDGELINP